MSYWRGQQFICSVQIGFWSVWDDVWDEGQLTLINESSSLFQMERCEKVLRCSCSNWSNENLLTIDNNLNIVALKWLFSLALSLFLRCFGQDQERPARRKKCAYIHICTLSHSFIHIIVCLAARWWSTRRRRKNLSCSLLSLSLLYRW